MGNTVGKVESGLAVVVIVVSILGIIGAVVAFVGTGKLYDQVGKGDLALDRDPGTTGPPAGSAAARAEAEAEIRQLVEAKSARRVARGEPPLDVDAEVAALTRPQGHDAALRDEVRQLVIARNERLIRRGEEPLDVEAEVDRQLRDLGA
jgi:hypothetical protein